MKNLQLNAIIIIIITLLISCNKKEEPQFSNWKVDGVEYANNDATISIPKMYSRLASNSYPGFDFIFHTFSYVRDSTLPDNGNFLLVRDNLEGDPDKAQCYIYFETVFYAPSVYEEKYLTASLVNNKAQYILPEMWFVNYYDPTDSVLVEGIFREP